MAFPYWAGMRNISTVIRSLEKPLDLKLAGVYSLFISYNLKMSCLYSLNGFRYIFFCMTVKSNAKCIDEKRDML